MVSFLYCELLAYRSCRQAAQTSEGIHVQLVGLLATLDQLGAVPGAEALCRQLHVRPGRMHQSLKSVHQGSPGIQARGLPQEYLYVGAQPAYLGHWCGRQRDVGLNHGVDLLHNELPAAICKKLIKIL